MITYKCECGKGHRVPDENAGHKFTCPACGRVGVVRTKARRPNGGWACLALQCVLLYVGVAEALSPPPWRGPAPCWAKRYLANPTLEGLLLEMAYLLPQTIFGLVAVVSGLRYWRRSGAQEGMVLAVAAMVATCAYAVLLMFTGH